MSRSSPNQLDPRAWLVWALACSLPSLVGRNPLPLLVCLMAAIAVRQHWRSRARQTAAWGGLLKLAAIFTLIGAVFNALTVRSGDVRLFTIPDDLPLIGGVVTANALVFGILSGLAILVLVTAGMTVASLLDWAATLRLVPRQFMGMAVAGSVALTFLPQTVTTYREIREAQAVRGHRVRGARDLGSLLAPLLNGGLERAVTLAEALESRAFGAPPIGGAARVRMREFASVAGVGCGVIGAYVIALGNVWLGIAALITAAILFILAAREGASRQWLRTRYRPPKLARWDWYVLGGASAGLVFVLGALVLDPESLQYEPYPRLVLPDVNLLLLIGLLGLFVPALAPFRPERDR